MTPSLTQSYRRCFAVALAAITLLNVSLTAWGKPPIVVSASPDNGQQNVDAKTDVLRIEFDQPMNQQGLSVVGGGESFPKVTGKPRWEGDRVFLLPIQLEENHEYRLSINSDRSRNFKSVAGESAVPYPIAFRTSGKLVKLTTAENEVAIERLQQAIDRNYSYRDLHGIDWAERFRQYHEPMRSAETPQAFAQSAGILLAAAKDVHLWMQVQGTNVATFQRPAQRNFHGPLLNRIVPNLKRVNRAVLTGQFDDGIHYLAITTFQLENQDELRPAVEYVGRLTADDKLILDVRPNSGGSEYFARGLAGCFVPETVTYAQHVIRDPKAEGGFTAPQKRQVGPLEGGPKFRGKTAVLMGPVNMSSAEAFLLMMKQAPTCKLIGAASYGSSGNPQPLDLGNEVTVWIPSWQAMSADGSLLEGKGIQPDIVVPSPNLETRDSVLEAALNYLRSGD